MFALLGLTPIMTKLMQTQSKPGRLVKDDVF